MVMVFLNTSVPFPTVTKPSRGKIAFQIISNTSTTIMSLQGFLARIQSVSNPSNASQVSMPTFEIFTVLRLSTSAPIETATKRTSARVHSTNTSASSIKTIDLISANTVASGFAKYNCSGIIMSKTFAGVPEDVEINQKS